ncbi:hypothetical protein MKW98_005720 [Papaver atlanticum]|uniref:NADH dehydrogenase-like complex L n=1 Tax=Papaver atlanticum TaxID=357466 RepID=A0AAD4RZL5_9MAGN|nr:hypothetical protein MKW98_005720 [Papaver atlanticum]
MTSSLSLSTTKALPSPSILYKTKLSRHLSITCKITQQKQQQSGKPNKIQTLINQISLKPGGILPKNSGLAIQIGALLSIVEQPALAITGVNNEEELSWILIQLGILAFWYFLIMPPIIMNWMRTRWYKRKFVEMYFQFLCTFMFFPGILLWAPFLNFRQRPQDPNMKYPWSTPSDQSLTE